jgi:hypothetical protein
MHAIVDHGNRIDCSTSYASTSPIINYISYHGVLDNISKNWLGMSWNEGRTIVEAYSRLRKDCSSLTDACLVDDDIATLLNARYNFSDVGITLNARLLNFAMSKNGLFVLGHMFDSHPQMNLTGHYRVWHYVRRKQPNGREKKVNTAFYYASSEKYCLATPNIPLRKDQWEKAVKNSSQLTSDLLQSLRPCEDDVVVQALLEIRNKKDPKQRVPFATRTANADADESLPKNSCVGWSGEKYSNAIKYSLATFIETNPLDGELPTEFPFAGRDDFIVRADDRDAAIPFRIFASGENACTSAVCNNNKSMLCPACTSAANRLYVFMCRFQQQQDNKNPFQNITLRKAAAMSKEQLVSISAEIRKEKNQQLDKLRKQKKRLQRKLDTLSHLDKYDKESEVDRERHGALTQLIEEAMPLIETKYGDKSLEAAAFKWQLENLETAKSSTGIRYNDTIYEVGLTVLAGSKPAVYDMISRILHLPSRRQLQRYNAGKYGGGGKRRIGMVTTQRPCV